MALESADGAQTYARTVITDVGCSWEKHRATLTASGTDSSARLAIRLTVRMIFPPLCSDRRTR